MKAALHTKRWIDISVPLHPGMVHWPGDPEFQSHLAQSLEQGDACNLTAITTSVHIGTHMDAPKHFLATGAGIDELPLQAVLGPCRVIPIKDKEAIRPAELRNFKLRAGERLLFKTRNSSRGWRTSQFLRDFVHISREGAQYLVDCGVQTVGVDYLSVGGFGDGVETHQILLGARIWIIEGLNLARAPAGRYELVCLPIKIRGSDGAPARALLRKR